ncbi:MAG: ATP synthase F0 subunit B [Myxococcales bacterium]|nr:ATP synthase F0 subunit B [Myxococcales bacterium]MDD9970589.1 ATP synthase F0 subunit B [Myxococcales bacterium]
MMQHSSPNPHLGRLVPASLLLLLLLPSLTLAEAGGGGHGHVTVSELLGKLEFWGAIVNFVLLIFLIRKLAGRPLQAFLDERRDRVEQGMKEAAELKAKAEAVYKEYTERLQTMDTDIEKLREDGKRAAEAERQRILAEAEEASTRMRAETEALIARHREELAQQVRKDVVEAAVAAAETLLHQQTSTDDQARLATAYRDALSATEDRT